MILRRVIQHFRKQEWTAIAIDFVIVVFGVFIGIQVANWNQAVNDQQRREQIVDGLVTNLDESKAVQQRFIAEIDRGLIEWQAAFARGEKPVPVYFRHEGSDTAPKIWETFEQMQLATLFDPVTLFDLVYFYSELAGIGQKYIRYVTFVEDKVLPGIIAGNQSFYDHSLQLKPEFRANMDRLKEYQGELKTTSRWINCLIYRLEAKRQFEHTCRRVDYQLEGMDTSAMAQEEKP